MKCPHCGAENRQEAQFCRECGTHFDVICPSCSTRLEPGSKFCDSCGASLPVSRAPVTTPSGFASPRSYTPPHLAEKILTSRSALEGERKQVTVLFCDLANSTALAERLGPEAMHGLLNRFFELALGEVHRYEGTINQFLGDGFMALFGAPLAHEDHARRAVLAALGLQRALRERSADLGLPHGEELSARMGLNTGLVVVGKIGDNLRMDYTAVGDTTHLAARLQQLAEPNTILGSETTNRLVRGYVRLEALEPVQVKGRPEPVKAYKVIGLGRRRSPLEGLEERALSSFVGRERELAALRELLAEVERGQGQVVGIVGEPGVGKSRLLYEFRQSLRGKRLTYLEGRCLSYGSAIPYLPILEILRYNCGLTDDDPPKVIGEKVRASIQEVGMDPEECAPYLLWLFGVKEGTERLEALAPEVIQARSFQTLRQLSLKGSQRRPIIFAVEDLHWIDKTSEDYLVLLVESLAGAAIFLLVTYRPGYRPPWLDKSYATQIALRPLSPEDSRSVVHSVAPLESLPGGVVQTILEKGEGNPFFLEELTKAVVEQGNIGSSSAVPDTIQGIIMARIDRLPEDTKRVLQTAAVLGREVSLQLLSATWEGPGSLEGKLSVLTRLEFLYEQSWAAEPVYVFKHALTQEVAYESLLISRRQALHAAAGQALEVLYADHLEPTYDRLAYHYSKTEDAAKAVEYLILFARQAARRFAHAEAVTALQEALIHVERLPAEERDARLLDIIPRLARSLSSLGRLQEALDLLLAQRERVEQLQNPFVTGRYYLLLAYTYTFVGDRERAAQSAHRAINAAKECDDEATMGRGSYVLAMEGMWSGQFQDGVQNGREAVCLLERTGERPSLGLAHWVVGANYAFMGDLDSATEAANRAHAIGEGLGDSRVQAPVLWLIGLVHAMRGEWDRAIDACKGSVERSPDPRTMADALGHLGSVYVLKGDPAEAIPLLEQTVQLWRQFPARPLGGWYTTWLAEAHLLTGQLDRAQGLATEGLELVRGQKYAPAEGLALRALGRIVLTRGALSEAEVHLRQAFAVFSSISARYFVAHTHLDLAALANAQGNREGVTTHLKEALSLFKAMRVPRYVERTQDLAREFGVALPEEPEQP